MKSKLLTLYFILSTMFILQINLNAAVKVVEIKGKASYKTDAKWINLQAGQVLKIKSQIMTGARSSVKISFNSNLVTLRSMSKMKIYQNLISSKESITQIGLKFGSINAKIKHLKKVKTVFKISTPVATSSVRGTEEEISFWRDRGMQIIVLAGSVTGESSDGTLARVSGKQVFTLKKSSLRPEHLFLNQFKIRFVNIADPNITPEEQAGFILGRISQIDTFDNFLNTPLIQNESNNLTNTEIKIIWP